MTTLELKYAANQEHQMRAIESTVALFKGQANTGSGNFVTGVTGDGILQATEVGNGNVCQLTQGKILENLHAVQEDNCLAPTNDETAGSLRDFTIDGIPWVETSVEEHACVIHELLREHIHEYTER